MYDGSAGEQQRAEGEAAEARGVAATGGREQRPGGCDDRADEQHRAEHVEEEREVPAVRPDVCEKADHAPGFQTIRTRITTTSAVPATCSQKAREGPYTIGSSALVSTPDSCELRRLERCVAVERAALSAERACDEPEDERRDDPEIPEVVRLLREREPDAEDERPDGADDHHHRADPGDEHVGGHASRRVGAPERDDHRREDDLRAEHREGGEQVERKDPVVQAQAENLLGSAVRFNAERGQSPHGAKLRRA